MQKSETYKSTMNKYVNQDKLETQHKLQKLHSYKPKEFWKILNPIDRKSGNPGLNIDEFYECFKTSNSSDVMGLK